MLSFAYGNPINPVNDVRAQCVALYNPRLFAAAATTAADNPTLSVSFLSNDITNTQTPTSHSQKVRPCIPTL
jgi:hypothetical protein